MAGTGPYGPAQGAGSKDESILRVQGIDRKLEELRGHSFEPLLYKRFGPEVAFAYVETPPELGGHVIELLEMP